MTGVGKVQARRNPGIDRLVNLARIHTRAPIMSPYVSQIRVSSANFTEECVASGEDIPPTPTLLGAGVPRDQG